MEHKKPLQELNFQVIFLGCLLAVGLAASNAYLGLKVGRSISGSIPAAVLSMGILHWIRRTNILQHNMVQTIASAGESVAASLVFVLPALIMAGSWSAFSFGKVFLITVVGGFLGILFSVPLRRILIIDKPLPFPEGLAVVEVLKAGQSTSRLARLLLGGAVGMVSSVLQAGLQVSKEAVHLWKTGFGTVFGTSVGISPLLTCVGYIIGLRTCCDIFVGVVLGWGVILPILGLFHPVVTHIPAHEAALALAKEHMRYIAVGAMIFGGAESIFFLGRSIAPAIRSSLGALSQRHFFSVDDAKDIPMGSVIIALVLGFPVIAGLGYVLISGVFPHFSLGYALFLAVFSVAMLYVIGILCALIAGYLTGIQGTTNLPISGVTISAIILFSLILMAFFGVFSQNDLAPTLELVLVFAGIIAIVASMCGDNLQDLKAGYLVGSTPWKQQVMLFFGVVCSALIMPFILQLLLTVYGFGDVASFKGDLSRTLPAPQATLMKTIATGVFSDQLNWHYLIAGACIGMALSISSSIVRKRYPEFRVPVLSVALGIYLPPHLTTPMLLGGVLAYWMGKSSPSSHYASSSSSPSPSPSPHGSNGGIVAASGLIAGETLAGLVMAVPFALKGNSDVLSLAAYVPDAVQYAISGVTLVAVVLLLRWASRGKGSA